MERVMTNIDGYQYLEWLSSSELTQLDYSDYWNDEQEEEKKEWNILDGNFSKMEGHLSNTGLVSSLETCITFITNTLHKDIAGVGLDLACGSLWAAPHLLSKTSIDKLYCLEFSKHRLTKLGPKVLNHYNIDKKKAVLVFGSFYKIDLSDNSVDFVLLSSAFHHAEYPTDLLNEINKKLKPGGLVMILGEHKVPYFKELVKHIIKFNLCKVLPVSIQNKLFKCPSVRVKKNFPAPCEIFPTDPILGDHYYVNSEYKKFFKNASFDSFMVKEKNSVFSSFILIKKALIK